MVTSINELVDPSRLDFDPDSLRAKYREERDKRIRADGNEQYHQVIGDFSRYVDDPYVDPGFARKPIIDDTEVAIIGGGFGGLLAGARLREAGVEDLRIIEKGGDFGGTWYWNRYPGAMCDIESYIYFPLLDELNYVPTEKYAHAPEILAYARRIAEQYDLYTKACLQTEVTDMRWDDSIRRWILSTNRGDRIQARFVAMSNGPLNRPKLPGIAGIDSFQGHTFHTSRWDYDYTGGDTNGNLTGLEGKRVGIIGTGATAIQCMPHLGVAADHLYVFQRTPSSIDVRDNRPTDPAWAAGLEPGWQERRMDNFNILISGGFQDEDMVGDGWTEIFRNLGGFVPPAGFETLSPREMAAAVEMLDFQKMEKIRARVDSIVKDEVTAEALKPYYRQFCKRQCFHDEYLDTYNLANVTLVDTQGQGVERITNNGVVVDGEEYEIDCLIFATGFEVGTAYTRRAGYDIVGRDGLKLSEKWADGTSSFHGLHSHGFPNCYFMGLVQSVLTPNFPHLLNEQSKHIAYVIKHARDHDITIVEAKMEAEAEWVDTIRRLARLGERFFAECTPGYYNNEGNPDPRHGFLSDAYGGGPVEFFQILKTWRDENTLQGLRMN
ncbi:MAG: NAD(P)/FAD-dependent oxidoreductase [Gammaproteobacteria bacterium]|nr:NAD(P)/FAD-dependent oxidoreductase [Gammaproteobacteria bacterium]